MAERIAVNAKVQRPGVCNAMETLLVHDAVAPRFLPPVRGRPARRRRRGCAAARARAPSCPIAVASEETIGAPSIST